MKPVVGIVSNSSHKGPSALGQTKLENTYVVSVEKAGGIPLVFPCHTLEENMDPLLERCDCFLLSGGADISPCFYHEEPHAKLAVTSLELDRTQIAFTKKLLKSDKPVLAICRGLQILNIVIGGTLYQDLTEHENTYVKHVQDTDYADASHQINIVKGSRLYDIFCTENLFVNSYHHQAVRETGKDLKISARSKDNIIEALELPSHPFCIGVQWHPEVMFSHGDESMRPLFESFVNACK